MKVDGKPTRTIWVESDGASVGIIDQTLLPHRFAAVQLRTLEEAAHAIKSMQVRGAPLIGAVAVPQSTVASQPALQCVSTLTRAPFFLAAMASISLRPCPPIA